MRNINYFSFENLMADEKNNIFRIDKRESAFFRLKYRQGVISSKKKPIFFEIRKIFFFILFLDSASYNTYKQVVKSTTDPKSVRVVSSAMWKSRFSKLIEFFYVSHRVNYFTPFCSSYCRPRKCKSPFF